MRTKCRGRAWLLAVMVMCFVCGDLGAQGTTFNVLIDASLKPEPDFIPGGPQKVRPTGIIRHPKGLDELLVANEILIRPDSAKGLEEFINRYHAAVLHDGKIPLIPEKYRHQARKIPPQSGYYLVRIDPAKVDLKRLTENGSKLGLTGTYRCSSPEMQALLALCLEEWVQRRTQLNVNRVLQPTVCHRTTSEEYKTDPSAPNPALANNGFMDAFQLTQFSDPDLAVDRAWQLFELYGQFSYEVPLCIIDGGFNFNEDFPGTLGYDFVYDDYDPEGSEQGYHGTGSLSMATATLNNRFGSAGTGALAASPMPFRHDFTDATAALAIRTAVGWGAKIVSMSFGGECDWWCSTFGTSSGASALNDAIAEAVDHGLILFAAAGNDEVNIGSEDRYYTPAESGTAGHHPIKVGAIDLNSKRAVRQADGYNWGSNYGGLDIWAPGAPRNDIWITPRPPDTLASHFGGTSCACPYTAGIAAMICALYPEVNQDEMRNILRQSAVSSADARVIPGFVSASAALSYTISHYDVVSPDHDDQEPSSRSEPFLIRDTGEYCGNLCTDDPDDGFYFILDDYTHLQIDKDQPTVFSDGVTQTDIGDPGDPSPLPFDGELPPGCYHINISQSGTDPNFYALNYTVIGPAAMAPDAYEVNNTLATAAALRLPRTAIGATWTVSELNFHRPGDPDFYDLSLPDLPDSMMLYDERVQITVEPTGEGYASASLDLDIYDTAGHLLPLLIDCTATIDEIRSTFPDRKIRFRVGDDWNLRNFYRIVIGYDRWRAGVELPSTMAFIETPDWMNAEASRHLLQLPPSALDGIPMDLPFPSDPQILAAISTGKQLGSVPPEMLVLTWPTVNDLVMTFSFNGLAKDLNFGLVDSKGEVFLWAEEIPALPRPEEGELSAVPLLEASPAAAVTGAAKRQIRLKGAKRSVYGIRVEGKKYPLFYRVEIDKVLTSAERVASVSLPVKSVLHQNYPNPFNPATTILFDLARPAMVQLEVCNILGERVALLMQGRLGAGTWRHTWTAKDEAGRELPNGLYLCRLTLPDGIQVRKMMLVR